MKRYLFYSVLIATMVHANNAMPGSSVDASIGDAVGDTAASINQMTPGEQERAEEELRQEELIENTVEQERQQEEERQEELLENRYDVPDEREEEEFNKNGY